MNQVIHSISTAVFIHEGQYSLLNLFFFLYFTQFATSKSVEPQHITSEIAVNCKQNRTNVLTVSGAPVNVGTFVVELDVGTLCCP